MLNQNYPSIAVGESTVRPRHCGVAVSACKTLETIRIEDVDFRPVDNLNDLHGPQLGNRAANSLDGQAKKISDVRPAHRQLHDIRLDVVRSLVAFAKIYQESGDALHCSPLANGYQEAPCSG